MFLDKNPLTQPDKIKPLQDAKSKLVNHFSIDNKPLEENVERLLDDNLKKVSEIESLVEKKMETVAYSSGGQYFPPTDEDLSQKFTDTILSNPLAVQYGIDENSGRIIHPRHKKFKEGSEPVRVFNESGLHGAIIFPKDAKESPKDSTRLYRGSYFLPGRVEVAPLARAPGVDVQDIYDYASGKITMDSIIEKITDPKVKEKISVTLSRVRESANKNSTTEIEEIGRLHTVWVSGAVDLDLWVSAANNPEESYVPHNSSDFVYGDFISPKGEINAIMILDVPQYIVLDRGEESGILGCIRPEWISALVPASGKGEQLQNTISRVEQLLN